VAPGFVETHIHLDKSRISHRCTIREGTLQQAIAETARAKAAFTEEDIVARGWEPQCFHPERSRF
jgi:cytosine deaminase